MPKITKDIPPIKSPADLADNRRQNPKRQNSLNLKQSVFLCEIIQLVVFLCVICAICGKITRKSTQTIHTNETPMSPADPADNRRQTPKRQNSLNLKQFVFLCVIMQLAAFLCVICAICGRIFTQEYSINIHRRNPNVSRRSR